MMEEALMKHKPKRERASRKERPSLSLLERIQPDAAGIDRGQNSHFIAVPPTARKLALLVYRALSGNLLYNDPGAAAYQQLHRSRELKSLHRRARLLGFHLVDQTTGEVLNAVS